LCRGPASGPAAFTLTELLVVIGLITMLMSLLLPVVGRARSAAQSTACVSNLRQMAAAWEMYTSNSRGQLMHYAFRLPATPDYSWYAYWPGILDAHAVRGNVLLCPAAAEPTPDALLRKGFGSNEYAWTGRLTSNGSTIRLNATTYRDSSYGFNRYLAAASGGFGPDGMATKITGIKGLSDVPLFMDSVWLDTQPINGRAANPVDPPPNLTGGRVYPGGPADRPSPPEHWYFLIARHGRGINVAMADGSARWVRLGETYMLKWRDDWVPYRLPLPAS
jgi:prepilin-type processing-associated H-X9-DG protein